MHALRKLVIDHRIRSHLRASLALRPIFSRLQKAFADSLSAVPLSNVPAFDISDGARRIAAFGVGTEAAFQKGDERSVRVFRDENDQRQHSWGVSGQDEFQLPSMFFGGGFWPERCKKSS